MTAAALQWYGKVESGDYWSQAQLRIAEILVRSGKIGRHAGSHAPAAPERPEQSVTFYLMEGQVLTDAGIHRAAYDLYAEALQTSPDNDDLLYAHSLAAEKLGKLDVQRETMRQLLEQDPDNVRTLNALGYTLADRTDRYEEALGYISKAPMHRSPDDPAIIDSLGWVYFRLGNLAQARRFATGLGHDQDSEIGAHLGEVMWVQGTSRRGTPHLGSLAQDSAG